jgi:DNA-binding IclR family transcriptional regulator
MTDALVKSASRPFEILEHFESVRRPLRLSEIAARSRYPTSSTAALLKSMTVQGVLRYDPHDHTYFPAEKLIRLVHWLPQASFESGVLRTVMSNLQQATGEFVALATVRDVHVEYVDTMRSLHDVQYWSAPGARRLLIQSGMGWLLLGQKSPSEIAAIYKRTVSLGLFKSKAFTRDKLLAIVEKARRAEITFTKPTDFTEHPAKLGAAMIAMLVRSPANHRPLVLGVGGPADRLSAHRAAIVRHMRTEIARLEPFVKPATGE